MAVVGVDVGGTKIAVGIFEEDGRLIARRTDRVAAAGGDIVKLIGSAVRELATESGADVDRLGACVPGIYYADRGTVWAPNIEGWSDYPLVDELGQELGGSWSIHVDSDRACSVLGEEWQGRARGCSDVIFLAVGTGIGAGILIDGRVVRGVGDAAGAIGWLALDRPYRTEYDDCGCFEYHASGAGIAKVARDTLDSAGDYNGVLTEIEREMITAEDVFAAYASGDPIAERVIGDCISYWGMAVANLVSLFNPEMIVFGGGVFESAASLLPHIREEARRWAQPISIDQVTIDVSQLGPDAGLCGAARLALREGA